MFRQRLNEFTKVLYQTTDAECLEILDDLISSASDYIKRVNILEMAVIVSKVTKDGNEYREQIENLEKLRSSAHNDLIDNVKSVNRLCRLYNLPEIFDGNVEARVEIAEFANQLTIELFTSRRL